MGYLKVRSADIGRLRGPIERQVKVVREFHGCEHYAFGIDVLEPELLRVSERWRRREMQSAHLVGDHMVEFNIGMRAAKVIATEIDCYQDGVLRRLLQIPATSFRPEREEKDMVVVMGATKFAPGEIDRLMPQIAALIAAARASKGCDLFAYARDVIDPDVLLVSERWRDTGAIAAHEAAPHTAEFNAAMATAKIKQSLVKAHDMSGERVLVER
jgi:quinol monooxygenase YgiN